MKTAQELINKWIEKKDTDVFLFLNGVNELPELPAGLEYRSADSATTLPELPAGLEYLSAASATTLPELPAGLKTLYAASADNNPE